MLVSTACNCRASHTLFATLVEDRISRKIQVDFAAIPTTVFF